MGACCSRTNADDRLPADPLGRIQSGDGVVEGRDVADVRPQSSVPHPLDDLTQLGAIGHANKVDRLLTVGSSSGADDVSAELTCELRHHRTDYAGRPVHDDALPRLKPAMVE